MAERWIIRPGHLEAAGDPSRTVTLPEAEPDLPVDVTPAWTEPAPPAWPIAGAAFGLGLAAGLLLAAVS